MKTIRVVLDTNVVVSAHLNSQGYERHVLDLVLARRLQLAASEAILSEYAGVLARPKFKMEERQLRRSLGMLRDTAKLVNPHHSLKIAPDPDDNRFLECAEAARADFLVTGDERHFPRQWRQTLVVNAKDLLEWIVPELRR